MSIILARGYPRKLSALAQRLKQPQLAGLLQEFLVHQINPGPTLLQLGDFPSWAASTSIFVHESASAMYYAPSDPCGVGGMHREIIRSVQSWRGGAPRRDCVFVNTEPTLEGMRGLDVVRILSFLSFQFRDKYYPCTLVHWFSCVDNEPDEDTGMWIVAPDITNEGTPKVSILHLDCIVRAAHLIAVYGNMPLPNDLKFPDSLDAFHTFYVNKFADHHAFEIAF